MTSPLPGSESGEGSSAASGSSTTGDEGSGGVAGSSGSSTSTGSSSSGAPPPDFGTAHPPGCQGKIDFLFVISSWLSMKADQEQLQEAFPAFIKIIEEDFATFDYHIMVVDAGLSSGMQMCQDCWKCQTMECAGEGCEDWGGPADYPCDEEYQECDWVAGAGVTMPGNFGASNKRCDLYGDGQRYIIHGQPELEKTFQCIATLGEGPKTSVVIEAMTKALQPEILAEGGCNAGFLRDDALLVVVLIQGATDWLSGGYPKDWWYFLQEKKNYNKDAIVVLVISQDYTDPDGWCKDGDQSNNLRTFVETVEHGMFESICAPSYVPFLEEAAELILDQCSLLIPQ